ncbi:U2 snRNP complex subunit [Malassezia equina]|uniref:U2 small nuclear ribonucleoprotein A' n=1 Tax=Malassezia equina TaxID=1381935 RepID=A0AAF0EAS4_9BASI|nr:U2 snRNP complex subunit [Malassezia equina]
MKLTAELLAQCDSSLNPLKDRELDLRGLKIPEIENLGASRDQNDLIDLTDNDVRFLGNFPRMTRLTHLIVSNNLVTRIEPLLHKQLPFLETLVLTNNQVADYRQLVSLRRLRRLRYLSLMGNPIAREKHYRAFLVWRLPALRVLDYRRITERERAVAKQLMESHDGRPSALARELSGTASGARAVASQPEERPTSTSGRCLTPQERAALAEAIEKSESMEEIRKLEEQLKLGYVPGASSDS